MLQSSGRRFAARAMSGTELSRVPTELRLLPPEAYQQKSDRVERGRHCYAIKWKLVEYRPADNRPIALLVVFGPYLLWGNDAAQFLR